MTGQLRDIDCPYCDATGKVPLEAALAAKPGGMMGTSELANHVRALLEHCQPFGSALELNGYGDLDGEKWATRAAELIGMDPEEIGAKW